ncbi:tyrosine-type recombinase/integrase [Helicovermis profundi]|uniref:Tyrosine-type recombinase/integrase n=1 Tax=Helicovermis profundi TaxID=3065157 RepID=A0AAU9EQM3_9FIRM|nr:tyrosine-type recombinase/integrase [Clostridia bacterium S502]
MTGYVRKRGKKWCYCFDIGDINGKRKRIERIGGNTKRECEISLRNALNEYDTGYIEPNKTSINDYLSDWLENHIKVNRKINTYNRYQSILKNNILPIIGTINIKDLKPIHIDNMLSIAKKNNLSNTTLQHIYAVLNSALNKAVKLRLLNNNPCEYIERPKRDNFNPNVLSVDEFYNLLKLLNIEKYNDYIFSIALHMVLELGLRRGELSGIEWCNINFDESTISIKNNLIYSHGKTYLTTPKTNDSERVLYISKDLCKLLKEHKKIQLLNKLKYGSHYIKNFYNDQQFDFIMTWEKGNNLHPMYFSNKFSKLMKASSIDKKVRFHDLRHTNATLLLSQGVDFKTIQIRLGHSDINTTLNIYSHVNLEMQKKAVNKLTTLFNGDKLATNIKNTY